MQYDYPTDPMDLIDALEAENDDLRAKLRNQKNAFHSARATNQFLRDEIAGRLGRIEDYLQKQEK